MNDNTLMTPDQHVLGDLLSNLARRIANVRNAAQVVDKFFAHDDCNLPDGADWLIHALVFEADLAELAMNRLRAALKD